MGPFSALFIAIAVLAAVAAYTDLRTGLISNRLVAAAFVGALPLRIWVEWQARAAAPFSIVLLSALAQAAAGAVLTALVPLVLFRLRAMGGGDVKLLAAVGALAGPLFGMEIELYAFVVAAVFAGAKLAYQGELLRAIAGSALLSFNPLVRAERRRTAPEALARTMAFAPAVLVSVLLCGGVRWVLG